MMFEGAGEKSIDFTESSKESPSNKGVVGVLVNICSEQSRIKNNSS